MSQPAPNKIIHSGPNDKSGININNEVRVLLPELNAAFKKAESCFILKQPS